MAEPKPTLLKIRYDIWRHKPYAARSGKLTVLGVWESEATQDAIRNAIYRKHKGWRIVGWALA